MQGYGSEPNSTREHTPNGVTATDAQMKALSLHRDEFRGDWNYEFRPR